MFKIIFNLPLNILYYLLYSEAQRLQIKYQRLEREVHEIKQKICNLCELCIGDLYNENRQYNIVTVTKQVIELENIIYKKLDKMQEIRNQIEDCY